VKELCSGAWYVNRLENRSNANGRNDLDNDNGRLLGITHYLVTGHFLFLFHFFLDLILATTQAISSYVIGLFFNLFLISLNLSLELYTLLKIIYTFSLGRTSHIDSCLCSIKLIKCPQTVDSLIPCFRAFRFYNFSFIFLWR